MIIRNEQNYLNDPSDTPHIFTLKQHGNDGFNVVKTWNKWGMFVGDIIVGKFTSTA